MSRSPSKMGRRRGSFPKKIAINSKSKTALPGDSRTQPAALRLYWSVFRSISTTGGKLKTNAMSKRFNEAVKLVDPNQVYEAAEAIKLAKQTSTTKFDASVEAHIKLNIDVKQSDQKVRAQAVLPHGTGKNIKVAAFVSGANEKEATGAGADVVGGEELIKQIKTTEKTDFDVAVAEPTMMKSLAQIAKILGQRGLMPNPKTGTVGPDIAKMVKEIKTGKIDVKTDDTGVIHQTIGNASFDDRKLLENFQALRDAVYRAKPASVKKDFVASVTLSSSMGPGIR